MKLTAVFHSTKVSGVSNLDPRLGANPPMTMEGMENILNLAPAIHTQGLYAAIFSSLSSRALCGASVLALALGFEEIKTLSRLGQYSNKDDDGTSIAYPGHEGDGFVSWQADGLAAVNSMYDLYQQQHVLAVSHRPIIGGLVAASQGINDAASIARIVTSPRLVEKGFVVFNFDGKKLELIN